MIYMYELSNMLKKYLPGMKEENIFNTKRLYNNAIMPQTL